MTEDQSRPLPLAYARYGNALFGEANGHQRVGQHHYNVDEENGEEDVERSIEHSCTRNVPNQPR